MSDNKPEKNSLCLRFIVIGAIMVGLIQAEIKDTILGTMAKAKETKATFKKIAKSLSKNVH